VFPGSADVTGNGLVVYVTVAFVVVIAVTTASEKVAKAFGPIGKACFNFAKVRREIAASKRAADVVALQLQIDGLATTLHNQSERHERERNQQHEEIKHLKLTAVSWERWAYDATIAAAWGGVTLPEPPSS
jgi:hypothetical protein